MAPSLVMPWLGRAHAQSWLDRCKRAGRSKQKPTSSLTRVLVLSSRGSELANAQQVAGIRGEGQSGSAGASSVPASAIVKAAVSDDAVA
jgi:hypothetical protein